MIVGSIQQNINYYYSSLTIFLTTVQKRVIAIWDRVWALISFKAPPYSYAFSQQSNPTCHLDMWANFHRLQLCRKRDASLNTCLLQDSDHISHREWLGKSFIDYSKWLQAKFQPKIKEYFQTSLLEAPLYPDSFNAKNKNYIQSLLHPFEQAESAVFSPYFMKEATASELSYLLPIYEEAGLYYCFDSDVGHYTPVVNCVSLRSLNSLLTPGQKKSLPEYFESLKLQKGEGRRAFIRALDSEISVGGKFVPREIGIYKLMLLNLGLGSDNLPLDETHSDFEVSKDLQHYMQTANTPWSPAICKKEHLIEYAIADIFKRDRNLFEAVKKRVDFYFKVWSRYENETKLKNRNVNRFLPGQEQMLAFCLMKNIQYLWVKSISSVAFCHHLGLPSLARFIPYIVGPSKYRQAAYNKQDNLSFIELWKLVKANLQMKYPEKKDWVSFSGHGMVLSMDPDLIKLQNQRNISDLPLAKDLGIACIDSQHGKAMDVFYKKSS